VAPRGAAAANGHHYFPNLLVIAPYFGFAPLEYIPTMRVVFNPASRMIAAHFSPDCGNR